eukprot:TRINITY_DN84863_c0_g1_i1.p1 TRINITY_DN84863_c0_g1~~TRINITY_DN84863_c0_g1_i1.p1  ORF type:complete len:275 (-),score=5.58 TRINITY_DN84863_c0_g1_i1:90-914(-)
MGQPLSIPADLLYLTGSFLQCQHLFRFRELGTEYETAITEVVLPNIESLRPEFTGLVVSVDVAVAQTVKLCRNLKQLDLSTTSEVRNTTENCLLTVVSCCKHLEELNIANCNISEAGALKIATGLTHLTSLDISGCGSLQSAMVGRSLVRNLGSQLRKLGIASLASSRTQWYNWSFPIVSTLLKGCTQLTALDISGTYLGDVPDLPQTLGCLPTLQFLKVYQPCRSIDTAWLCTLVKLAPNLTRLAFDESNALRRGPIAATKPALAIDCNKTWQ